MVKEERGRGGRKGVWRERKSDTMTDEGEKKKKEERNNTQHTNHRVLMIITIRYEKEGRESDYHDNMGAIE